MEGDVVSVEIEVIRNGGKRPSEFRISYSVNNAPATQHIILNN